MTAPTVTTKSRTTVREPHGRGDPIPRDPLRRGAGRRTPIRTSGPHRARTGTRQARDHGATAPQPALHPANAHLAPLIGPGWIRGDGQYLNLNVWTPDTGTRGLPVMVCIHGGGFVIGSGSAPAFDGASFARGGVVLVTINYRLGAEGFARAVGWEHERRTA